MRRREMAISIHALARRATAADINHSVHLHISIHALARRATASVSFFLLSNLHFNPRSRKESDKDKCLIGGDTHGFQSTLSQGERPKDSFVIFDSHRFQSTLSQGERRNGVLGFCASNMISIHALARRATSAETISSSTGSDFNPRSRKESDMGQYAYPVNRRSFQSTLSQGERPKRPMFKFSIIGFQSTLSQGERPTGKGCRK